MFLQSLCVTENGLITRRNATSTCLQFLGMLKPKPNPMFVVPSWQKCFDFWPFAFGVLRVCCHWQSQHRRRCNCRIQPKRSQRYVGGWDWDVMWCYFGQTFGDDFLKRSCWQKSWNFGKPLTAGGFVVKMAGLSFVGMVVRVVGESPAGKPPAILVG